MKQILDDFYTTVSKNNLEKVQSVQDIEKQIKEVETEAVKIEAAQNLKDYSKSEFNTVQFQKKPEFIPPPPKISRQIKLNKKLRNYLMNLTKSLLKALSDQEQIHSII